MFGFGKKKAAARPWASLGNSERQRVASRIVRTVRALARYKVVSGWDQSQREAGVPETVGEDSILDQAARGRLLNLTRNQVRNNATINAIIHALDEHVVGTCGGRAVLSTGDEAADMAIETAFARWTRSVDFSDGGCLNELLRQVLHGLVAGGRVLVLHDDAMIEDSGKLIVFDSDEIVCTDQAAIEARYGKGCVQRAGRVYSPHGRWIGSVVSRTRGKDVVPADQCYLLRRDPDEDYFAGPWTELDVCWRPGQGAGVTPLASTVGAVADLDDLCNFELQKAKKASQTYAQIVSDGKTPPPPPPSAFASGGDGSATDFSGMTDAEIEEAMKAAAEEETQTVTMTAARSAGILYEQMPDGYKMELLQANSPNMDVPQFVGWLAARSAASVGLSQVFATMVPDQYFRAQQLMAQPTFLAWQKRLERFLDWVIVRWSAWARRRGIITADGITPDNATTAVAWEWPAMDEVDEKSHQEVVAAKLRNLTASYRDILGAGWKRKLEEIARQTAWIKEHGLPMVAYDMISGGEKTGVDKGQSSEEVDE